MFLTLFRDSLYFSSTENVLVVSGTHGDPPSSEEPGQSGLREERLLRHAFYKEDCQQVGVEAGPNRVSLPIRTWAGVPDISRPAVRLTSPREGSFYQEKLLEEMDIRVANMSYYFGHTQKLLDDITEVLSHILLS